MEVIEIRHKVLLDAMLDEFRLPHSTSENVFKTDGTVVVTVMFFPSARSLQYINGQYSCESGPRNSVRAAENEAVYEAIQYMEFCQKKAPRDYNYDRVQRKQESEACLFRQLAEKDKEIQQLSENLDSLVGGIRGPSEKIEKIVRECLLVPSSSKDREITSAFLQIEKAASDHRRLALRSADLLHAAGTEYRGVRSFDHGFLHDTDE